MSRRFHFTVCWVKRFNGTELVPVKGWKCFDSLTDTIGIGITPQSAYSDCMMELEMDTSDIHQ